MSNVHKSFLRLVTNIELTLPGTEIGKAGLIQTLPSIAQIEYGWIPHLTDLYGETLTAMYFVLLVSDASATALPASASEMM